MFKSLLLCMGVSMSLFGQIHEIQSLQEIKRHLPKEESTLCIFDVDYTLTMPEDPYAHLPNIIKYRHVYRSVYKEISDDLGNLIRLHLVGDGDSILIEETTPDLLEELKKQGVLLMAYTASNRYHKGDGHWRQAQLTKLGIDFTTYAHMIAPESDCFCGGVLFGNFPKLKGPPLIKFLETAHVQPTMIVAVDDKKIHLESMEKELADLGIGFIGLWYEGAKSFQTSEVTEEGFINYYDNLRKIAES